MGGKTAPGWSWSDVAPLYKRIEDWNGPVDVLRGIGGSIAVNDFSAEAHPLCRTWLQAAREAQLPMVEDYNAALMEGASLFQINTKGGLRAFAVRGYLRPAMKRANLDLKIRAHASRVLFEGNRATGIAWRQRGTEHRARARKVLHRQVAPWVLGRAMTDLDNLLDLVTEREHKFPGSYLRRAMAGLDTAIWDLRGRQTGKPVAELLGGSAGPIRAYASSMKRDITPLDKAERLKRLAGEGGFTAFKVRAGAEVGRNQDEWPGRTEEIIPTMRRELGDDVDLLIDANSCYTPERAIEVGHILRDNGFCHYEKPCPYWELEQTKQVTDALDIDVTGGEQDCDLPTWRRMIDMRAVDIVQPDVVLSRRHRPHPARGQDGQGRRPAGHPALRQPVPGDAVHHAPAPGHSQCRQISRILDRGRGLLSLAGGALYQRSLHH